MRKSHSKEAKEKISKAKKGISNATLLRPTQQMGEQTLFNCSRCGHYLPKSEFYPSRTTLIGITATCKPCNREDSKGRRRKAKEEKLIQQ